MSQKNYFNSLFSIAKFDTELDRSFSELLENQEHLIKSKYLEHLLCSVESLMLQDEIPILRSMCLKVVHIHLCHIVKLKNSKIFLSTIHAPYYLSKLNIPLQIRIELLTLFEKCHRHSFLTCIVNNRFQTLYKVKNNTILFFPLTITVENLAHVL